MQSTILSLDNGLKTTYYDFNQLLNIVPSYGTPIRHQQSIRAISPGLGIVDILAKSPDGLHLTEIVRRACLSGNQTHHLLETLIQEGLVTQDGNLLHYRRSSRMARTHAPAPARSDKPMLADLSPLTGVPRRS